MSPFEGFREREWEPKTSSFSLAFIFSFPGRGGTLKTWPLDNSWLLLPATGFCFFTRALLSWSRRKERAIFAELAVRLRTLGPLLFVRLNTTGGRRGVGSSGLGTRLWTGLWGGWGVIRATRNLTERAAAEITWPKTTIWVVSGPSFELHEQQEDQMGYSSTHRYLPGQSWRRALTLHLEIESLPAGTWMREDTAINKRYSRSKS